MNYISYDVKASDDDRDFIPDWSAGVYYVTKRNTLSTITWGEGFAHKNATEAHKALHEWLENRERRSKDSQKLIVTAINRSDGSTKTLAEAYRDDRVEHGLTGNKNAEKDPDEKGEAVLHIRCTKEQKNRYVRQAKKDGKRLAPWIKDILDNHLK